MSDPFGFDDDVVVPPSRRNDPEYIRKVRELRDATILDQPVQDIQAEVIARENPNAVPIALASAARIPTDMLGITALPRMGYNAVEHKLTAPEEERDVVGYLGAARYGKGGVEKVQQHLVERAEIMKSLHPEIDQATLTKQLEDYMDSDEFKQYDRSLIPWNERIMENVGDSIDNFFGAPTDDDKTPEQFAGAAIAQSFVPIGAGVKVANAAIRASLAHTVATGSLKGANSVAIKIASEAAEQLAKGNLATKHRYLDAAIDLIVPGASTFNKKRMLAEAGISGTLAYGIAKGVDVLVDDQVAEEDEDDETATLSNTAKLNDPQTLTAVASVEPSDEDIAKEELAKQNNSALVGAGAVAGIAGAAFVSPGTIRRAFSGAARNAAQAAQTPNTNTTQTSTPIPKARARRGTHISDDEVVLREPSTKDHTPTSNAFAEFSGVRNAFDRVYEGMPEMKEFSSASDFTRNLSKHWRSNKAESYTNFASSGQFPNSTIKTHSWDDIMAFRRKFNELDIEADYSKMRLMETELDTRKNFIADSAAKLHKNTAELQKLVQNLKTAPPNASNTEQRAIAKLNEPVYKQMNKLQQERVSLVQDQQRRVNDDPDFRHSFVKQSTQDIETELNNIRSSPHAQLFAQRKQMEREFLDAHLDYMVEQGAIGQKTADLWKARNPNYNPFYLDDLGASVGKSSDNLGMQAARGLEVAARKLKRRAGWKGAVDSVDDYIDDKIRHAGYDPITGRTLSDDSDKIRQHLGSLEAIEVYSRRTVAFVESNNFRKSLANHFETAQIMRKRKGLPAVNVVQRYVRNGRSVFSREEIGAWKAGKNDPDLDRMIPVREGDYISFYTFDDPSIHQVMLMPALRSIPIASTFSNALRQTITGLGAPSFAPVSAGYDTFTIMNTAPSGRVMGTSAFLSRAMARFGYQPSEKAINALRVGTGLGGFDPVAMSMIYADAARLAWVTTKRDLYQSTLRSIETDFGLIGKTINSIPGMRDVVEKAILKGLDSFNNGITAQMIHGHAISDPSNVTLFQKPMLRDQLVEWDHTLLARFAGTTFGNIAHVYRNIFASVKESARYGYVLRNEGLIRHKYKGNTNDPGYQRELKKLINEARTITGDMAERPGNTYVQGAASIIPYSNIMMTSARHMFHRLRVIPWLVTSLIMPLAVARMGNDYMFSNWDQEAYDYYWRQMPDWQRTGFVAIPRPSVAMAWLNGEKVPFSPDKIIVLPAMDHILRPFVNLISESVRYTGIYRTTQNDAFIGNNYFGAFNESLWQAFGLAMPTIGDAITAATDNSKMDMRSILTGDIRDFGDTQGKSLNNRGNVNQYAYNLVGAVAGSLGKNVLEGYDVFREEYKREPLIDSIFAGLSEATTRAFTNNTNKPFILEAMNSNIQRKAYLTNPTSEEYFKKHAAITLVTQGNRDGRVMGKFRGDAPPELLDTYNYMRQIVNSDPVRKKQNAEYGQLSIVRNQIKADTKLPYNERMGQLATVERTMANMRLEQLKNIKRIEDLIKDMSTQGGTIGQVFKQKYGKEFTLENWKDQFLPIYNKNQALTPK